MDELNESRLRLKTAALRELYGAVDLEAALRVSHKHPVRLFKHSRACPVTHEALDQCFWRLQFRNAPISSYVITVQTRPKTCKAVTRILSLRHETSQAILVAAGRGLALRGLQDYWRGIAAAAKIAEGSGLKGEDRRPPRREEEPDDDDDEAPETPLDEPAPTPVGGSTG